MKRRLIALAYLLAFLTVAQWWTGAPVFRAIGVMAGLLALVVSIVTALVVLVEGDEA
jgi:hypothetical protein